ncbi:MAG TPA: tRNA (adenosine(37)-N6)-dimethylallyltransferase MiaA [Acholeplasma sp.]|jgi:tRNA dimethylallyltransferase|nr:tRNA (adenosine(37)-N6)-dimethylallyltransferase MiaA [Acholeplasma sp.]
MKKVVVITGPTGIGKTSISVAIAKHFNAEIISADSAQVYRDLNIGTAKIKASEMQDVKHHLINIVTPPKTYDVASYQATARNLIEQIERPFIVGGTGLYIQAAINDYDFSNEKRDESFEQKYINYSNEDLYNLLVEKDLMLSQQIHPNNRRRVLRALSGSAPKKKGKNKPIYDNLVIQLTLDRKTLYSRINARVDEMMAEGLLEEVKELKEKGLTFNIICYKQLNEYLDGKISLEEAVNEIKKVTRRYAKRQETWFNNQMDTVKIDVSNPLEAKEKIIKIIEEFYEV